MKYPTNKPTQAQIKVAKEAFYDRKLDEAGVGLSERFAAAITAAAEVGYSEPQGTGFQAGEAEPAAAEVGEPRNTELEMGELAHRLFLETIERCAQVVDKLCKYSNGEWIDLNSETIAAAIRALKDNQG